MKNGEIKQVDQLYTQKAFVDHIDPTRLPESVVIL